MARRSRKRNLLKELNQVLDTMPTKPSVGAYEEGELYICATCNLPRKLCELHGGTRCASMIRGNTQLEIVESSIHETTHRGERNCLRCSAPIPQRQLRRNPLRELCSDCSSTAQRKRRRPTSPGATT